MTLDQADGGMACGIHPDDLPGLESYGARYYIGKPGETEARLRGLTERIAVFVSRSAGYMTDQES